MIRSDHFKVSYGTRHRGGIILYRREPPSTRDLNIYYSPISDKKQEQGLEFSRLNKLRFDRSVHSYSSITRMVNGLVCVDYVGVGWLSLYNVCTGETMRVPDELPGKKSQPKYYLGLDPASRTYKLLRLTRHLEQAHIMTLRPSSSSSTWELIKFGAGDYIPKISEILGPRERKISPNDGFLGWLLPEKDLVLFDFSKEKFHKISIPAAFIVSLMSSKEGFVRAQFMERQQRLAVSLWAISRRFPAGSRMFYRPRHLEWFVMEDGEGKQWSGHFVELPLQLHHDKEVFAVPNGSLSAATSGTEMVVINIVENEVYCYEHTSKTKEAQFRVGKQSDYHMFAAGVLPYYVEYTSTLSCLCDANHLYLPLDDILSASK